MGEGIQAKRTVTLGLRHWVCALTLAALGGCAAAVTQPAGVSQGGPRPKNAVFATEIAGPDTYLPPMPTAVAILKPDDMARDRAFCQAMTKLPTAQEEMAKSVVAPNLILTRWLSQLRDVPADRVRDCDYLVGTYDYGRAAALMRAFRPSSGSLAGQGPFLAMIIPDASGVRVVAVDGSGYAASDFDAFVASWNEALSRTQAQISAPPDRPAWCAASSTWSSPCCAPCSAARRG